jgi:hypothetical protein
LKSLPTADVRSDAQQITLFTLPAAATSPPATSAPATNSSRRTLAEWTCDYCGKTFLRVPAEVAKARRLGQNGLYCDRVCSSRARVLPPRRCRTCGAEFPARRATTRSAKTFCSTVCRQRFSLITLVCDGCRQSYEVTSYDHAKRVRNGQKIFCCSKLCLGKIYANKCRRCGAVANKGSLYCSPACRKAVGNPSTRTVPDRACDQCGIVFRPGSSRRAYCSRSCANAAHSDRMVGSGNSKYKNGQSYALWFRSMRPLIMEREKWCCATCGAPEQPIPFTRKGKVSYRSNFHVHHIDENPSDNRAENLVALCGTCHATHHHSAVTPWPLLGQYAEAASASMTSKWQARVTSLQTRYSYITASSSTTPTPTVPKQRALASVVPSTTGGLLPHPSACNPM